MMSRRPSSCTSFHGGKRGNFWDIDSLSDCSEDEANARRSWLQQSKAVFKLFYQKIVLLEANPKHPRSSLASFDAYLAHHPEQLRLAGGRYASTSRKEHHVILTKVAIDATLDEISNFFIRTNHPNPSFIDFTTCSDLVDVLQPSRENPMQCIKLRHLLVKFPIPGTTPRDATYLEVMNSFVDEKGRRCWARALHTIEYTPSPNSARELSTLRDSMTSCESCEPQDLHLKDKEKPVIHMTFLHNGTLYRENPAKPGHIDVLTLIDLDIGGRVPRVFSDLLHKSTRKHHAKRLEMTIRWQRRFRHEPQRMQLAQSHHFLNPVTRKETRASCCRGCMQSFSSSVVSRRQCDRCGSRFCSECQMMVFFMQRSKRRYSHHARRGLRVFVKLDRVCGYCLGHHGPEFLLQEDLLADQLDQLIESRRFEAPDEDDEAAMLEASQCTPASAPSGFPDSTKRGSSKLWAPSHSRRLLEDREGDFISTSCIPMGCDDLESEALGKHLRKDSNLSVGTGAEEECDEFLASTTTSTLLSGPRSAKERETPVMALPLARPLPHSQSSMQQQQQLPRELPRALSRSVSDTTDTTTRTAPAAPVLCDLSYLQHYR